MSSATLTGPIVVAPHHFPGLAREEATAKQFGVELIATPDKGAFAAAIVGAEIVMITPYAKLAAEDFARMTRCKGVIRYGMGYDNIDTEAAAKANIPVSIVPGTANEEVASHALAMGLALVRRLPQGHRAIADGGWNGAIGLDTPKLSKLVVGVVGVGRIGRMLAGYWRALGAEVRGYDPFADLSTVEGITPVSLDEALVDSDVVSLHVPLNAETRNLVSAEVLDRMRPHAVLVNVSRGGLIDEQALAEALHQGKLAGAALDVFSDEPLPADHPLRTAPSTLLTPHIAWRSDRSLDALQEGAVLRLQKALMGEQMPDLV
ncbi:C-terminal binding protein [Mycolicibacterium setense]